MGAPDVLRVANCSGFYGDRLAAAREVLNGGPLDVLTGDYLAELTMAILAKDRLRDPEAGFATTFLAQLEEVLPGALARGVKIVSNAGGLNPEGLARRIEALCGRVGLKARVAWFGGDDLLARLGELQAAGHALAHLDTGEPLGERAAQALTANAYLGAWPIARALEGGADIVVCPRVTDASLVVGPAAWRFGWRRHEWDCLAGAVVAGHVLECGTQATGGNFAFFEEVDFTRPLGFPLAEIHADGSSVITKHPGTGGLVNVDTVTSQLLYELGAPAYANPDVVARFDSIALTPDGADRVRISGVRGEPAPAHLKVGITLRAGYANTMTIGVTGLDVEAKAALAVRRLRELVDPHLRVECELARGEPTSYLRVSARGEDPRAVGRAFSGAVVELYLTTFPGFYLTTPPSKERELQRFWPTLVPREVVGA